MKELTVNSSEALDNAIKENEQQNVVLLFTGTKNESTGKSWCPDCVVAEPIIKAVTQEIADLDICFITAYVGDLPSWKSSNNQFRKHPTFAINCVPTLINLSKNTKLEEGGCADKTLVKKLFEGSLEGNVDNIAGVCKDGVCRLR